MNKRRHWTNLEDEELRRLWINSSKEDLLTRFNRTWGSLISRACFLKLKRDKTHINVNGTKKNNYINNISHLDKILAETPESYYWAGFLTADAHFNTKVKRLHLTLSLKDEDHLRKFTNFINCSILHRNIYKNNCWVSIQDKNIIEQFIVKFNITHNKSYELNTPFIPSDDLFLSFMIGFIDGDGYVNKLYRREDCHIGIVGHSSSLFLFTEWFKRLYSIYMPKKYNSSISNPLPRLDRRGYARGMISNFEMVKEIKKSAIRLRLPIMNRKWDKIDLEKISRYRTTNELRIKILKLKDEGMSDLEIQKNTKVCKTTIWKVLNNRY